MENLDRPAKLKEFAETCANGAAFVLNPLSTDASSRKYYRMRCLLYTSPSPRDCS